MDKLILTIDSDAFFASCEELRNPELSTKPVIIAHMLNNKGIVTPANYLARDFGIKGGIPVFKATNYCPNVIIVEPDYEWYQEKAMEVFDTIASFTNKIQVASIDECYVDCTHMLHKYTPIRIAQIISHEIKKKTGLSVSIGISTNVFLSKMASKLDKPNGITTLYKHEIKDKMWTLPLIEMHMLGYSTNEKLTKLGMVNIGHLATLPNNPELYSIIKREIGINIDKLINLANGNGSDEIVVNPDEIKSISKEKTLEVSVSNANDIEKIISELLLIITNRLKGRDMSGKTVTLSLKKHKTFNKFSVRKTLENRTNEYSILMPELTRLLDELYDGMSTIKQVAISVSNLKENVRTYQQKTINIEEQDKIVNPLLEKLNFIDPKIQKELKISTGRDYKENRKFKPGKTKVENDNVKFKRWSD